MVNFNIVENYSHEHKFDAFKSDYIKGLSKIELVKKYDIPKSVWRDWKAKMPPRHYYKRGRPKRVKVRRILNLDDNYLKHTLNGNVTVFRKVTSSKVWSYSTYPSEEIAIMVRDKLKASDWDVDLADELLVKYAIPNSIQCLRNRLHRRKL